MYDVIIIGKGPAGISASLYAKRAGLSVLIIGKGLGALEKAKKVENYYGITASGKEIKTHRWSKDHFYFIATPSVQRNPGYPLDSISIIPEFNKYLVELTEQEKKSYKEQKSTDGVIEFITNNI